MGDPPRVALALGSGGARGYTHIGAIQVLLERGCEIASIAGSSMGALVGGLYAAGKLDEYTEYATGLSQLDVLRLLDVSLTAPGAIRAEKIFARVRDLFDGARIEEMPIPFTAIATDLFARRPVWFQHGPADIAIRASFAIPGVLTPVMLNGRLLVDGGLLEPVPIAPTASAVVDATIAIDLGGERTTPQAEAPARETSEPRPMDEWADRFRRSASHLLDRDVVRSLMSRFGASPDDARDTADTADDADDVPIDETFAPLPAGLGRWEVMTQSLEAMQDVVTRFRLAGNPPDVLVTVPKDACRALDFHRAAEMIALGRALTNDALDAAWPDGRPDQRK